MPKPETPRRRPDLTWRHRRRAEQEDQDRAEDLEEHRERQRELLRLRHTFDPEYGE